MSKTVQWKRGNANVSATYIGPQGEITVNTDDYSLSLHDGMTPGGYKISNDLDSNVNIGNLIITGQTISGTNSGQDIIINASTAGVQISNIRIADETIIGLNGGQDIILSPTNANLRLTGNAFTVANSLSLIADTANNFSVLTGTPESANDIKIQATNGTYNSTIYLWANMQRMSFNTISNAFDFNFNGQLSATDFTASKNSPYGYSFYTPGQGYAGFSHVNGSPEYLRISFANTDHTRYFANLTTQTVGNLVISAQGNVFGTFPNAFVQVYSNINSYAQFVMQNLNSGSESSADFVITSDDGTDINHFLDIGIASSTYNYPGYGIIKPHDTYILSVGNNITGPGSVDSGNLIMGSTTGNIVMFVGAPEDANVIAKINSTGFMPGANVSYSLGSQTEQWKDLWLSNIYVSGQTGTGNSSIVAGVTNTLLANSTAAFSANVNGYSQITYQNKNAGADATADFILTADNGSDTTNYLDVGIVNSGYDNTTPTNSLGNIVYAADGYIYTQGNLSNVNQLGGNLVIGTTTPTKNVKIFAGGATSAALVANIGNIAISQPNLPAFRVYGSSSNNIADGTTITSTQGATIDYNQGSYYNNSTGLFTAPVSGIYNATATLRVGSTDTLNQASIQKNSSSTGANVVAFWELSGNTATKGFGHMSMSGTAKLAAGDTLRLQVLLGNVQFDVNDSWGVTLIG